MSTSSYLIQTIDRETGDAPERRVATSHHAYELARKFISLDEARASDRELVTGLIEGRRPYSKAALRKLGQAWRGNVDSGTAGSLMEEFHAMYWDLLVEVPYLIRATIKRRIEKDALMRRKWSDLLSSKIHEFVVDNWPDFYVEMALMIDEMVKMGRSHIMFEDEAQWKFTSGKVHALLIPDGTTVRRDDIAVLGVVDHMPVWELFEYYRKAQKAHPDREDDYIEGQDPEQDSSWIDNGFDPEMLRQVIWSARNGLSKQDVYSPVEFEAWAQSQYNNDLHATYVECSLVPVYHLYVKEFSGRVSHFIVDAKRSRDNFIFQETGRYGSFEEVIFPIFRHYGDGYAHNVRGMGDKCFNVCELENRVFNSAMDTLMMSGSVLILNESGDENAHGSKILKMGPTMELPPGYKFEQNLIGANTSYLIGGLQFLQRKLMDTVPANRRETIDHDGQPPSATQASIDANDRANLRKSAVTFFYLQMDRVYIQMIKRMWKLTTEEFEEFKEECLDLGLPESIFEKDGLKGIKIRASRSLGMGSEQVRQRIARTAEKFVAFFDSAGRREAIRFNLSATGGGQDAVELFMPDEEMRLPTTETTLINLENAHFQTGRPLPVGVDQDHIMHSEEHLPIMAQAAQAGQQQGSDLQTAFLTLQSGIPHLAEHAEFMAQNPVDEARAKDLNTQIGILENALTQIGQQMQAQAEAQQRAQQQAIQEQQNREQYERQLDLLELQMNADARLQGDVYKENNLQQIRVMRENNKAAAKGNVEIRPSS